MVLKTNTISRLPRIPQSVALMQSLQPHEHLMFTRTLLCRNTALLSDREADTGHENYRHF